MAPHLPLFLTFNDLPVRQVPADRYEKPPLFCGHRGHRYVDASLGFGREVHIPIAYSENRVVFAHANAFARMPFGATLTKNDISRDHALTSEFLHAKASSG